MKHTARLALAACLAALAVPAWAHPGKGHGGREHGSHARNAYRPYAHDPYQGGSYKEDFRDGTCRIQRKWDKKGRYKEKRDCREHAPHASRHGLQPYSLPDAATLPGVYVHPPAVVIQPPGIVIR